MRNQSNLYKLENDKESRKKEVEPGWLGKQQIHENYSLVKFNTLHKNF